MRIDGKGLIDRAHRIGFTFDGQPVGGYEGDTVASALLAQDTVLVGRSFKYHRPRGILTAGSEEPNALITVGRGAQQDPNVRATMQEAFDGLVTRSQNRWPSLAFDAMAVNDLVWPFLGAGFYYKTFMWPRAAWEKLYEPVIRNAAGLGALSGQPDGDFHERAFAHCDVLVIGSGPAGLMAARTAAEAGADVILACEDFLMGGRCNAETLRIGDRPAPDWAATQVAELAAMDNVRLMPRTTVIGAYDGHVYGALERVGHHKPRDGGPRECFWRITAPRCILATGALERPVAFANNDRPGVMNAGAVRAYLNRWGVAPGQRIAVFGNNDDAHRTAADLADAGVQVTAVIDSRHDAEVPNGPYPVHTGAVVCDTQGRRALESVTIRHGNGREEKIAADCLAVSGGWNPSVHLTCHMGGRPQWEDQIAAFAPLQQSVPGLEAVGAAAGLMSTHGALQSGAAAGQEAAQDRGYKTAALDAPEAEDAPYRIRALWQVPAQGYSRARAWLDFQNDVTVKDIKQAARENFSSVEHMKRYTTQGMATDQGKNSNVAALAILADATGRTIPETGTTTFRAPYVPVSIAAMGAGAVGKGFAPERHTTSHLVSVEKGAPMIEAGLWYRPSYFPRPGEKNWRQSCDREVAYVRNTVAVADVSTLGKIDIQGPDAAQLLDFAYTNMFSTLKEGRVRYGLMLREDGHVMDDGTTARLGENHYVMTTTTAAAGPVMNHLEWIAQALHPEWQVSLTSVTEQWAQFAVAGPKSMELLNDLLDDPINDDDWPFMACGAVRLGGLDARLFRISFSGERGYEIAVPARYGESLFRELVSKAEGLGGGAYGMEALNVLRIEAGFITHAEIHGRTTAYDIGMGRMVSAKKDCIGKTMAARPGMVDPDRERLVGLRPVGAVRQLTAGAHLFGVEAEPVRENDEGYVTSVGYSPTLGHFVGLAMLRRGPDRIGERIKLVDHLRGIETICEITAPGQWQPKPSTEGAN